MDVVLPDTVWLPGASDGRYQATCCPLTASAPGGQSLSFLLVRDDELGLWRQA